MSGRDITDDLVAEVAEDLRRRYALDDEDVRTLGARLATPTVEGDEPEYLRFAKRFMAEHAGTFERLSR